MYNFGVPRCEARPLLWWKNQNRSLDSHVNLVWIGGFHCQAQESSGIILEAWAKLRHVRLYLQADLVRIDIVHRQEAKLFRFHCWHDWRSLSLAGKECDQSAIMFLLDLESAGGPGASGPPEGMVPKGEQVWICLDTNLGHCDVPV